MVVRKEEEAVEQALRASEQLYRTIVETAEEGVWTIDADGRTTFVNSKMATMLGYSVEEMIGRPMFDFMDEEARQLARRNVERRRRGIRERHDFKLLRKDGSSVWTSMAASPLYDAAGRYAGALAMVTDTTLQRAQAEAQMRLAAIVESAADAIVGESLDGIIRTWNPGAERLFGYSAGEAIGQPITTIFPPDRADEEQRILERLQRGERVETFESVRVRKDGTPVEVSATISPIRDASGRMVGASKFISDITSRKRAEEALRASEERSRAMISAMPDLLFRIDKDLRFLDVVAANPSQLALPPERFVGRTIPELFGERRSAELAAFADADWFARELTGSPPVLGRAK